MNAPKPSDGLTYASAGVSIDAGDELVQRIKPLAKRTMIPGVMGGIGGFGALFEVPKGYRDPILVTGTDGVGTKLKLAFALDKHDTIGQDLVAMNVNDILVQGAKPLFFLDYFACGKLDVDIAEQVIGGIAKGCELAGCALIGGETAEMPGMYPPGEYDLAGFTVGVVEKTEIIDGGKIAPGDALLGVASSGPHSNGYSLVRKVVETSGASYDDAFGDSTLGATLIAPTRIYCKQVLAVNQHVRIRGMAHITGGGMLENVPRVLPASCQAVIYRDTWKRPAIFDWLQEKGRIDEQEMYRVFNCGIGLVVVVGASDVERALAQFKTQGEQAWKIGTIRPRAPVAAACIVL